MASIRTRVTTAYALALGGTMLAFGVAIWTARRASAYRELQAHVQTLSDIGERLVRQATEANRPLMERSDSLVGSQLVRPLRTLMEGVPDYLVVIDDSGRIAFASFQVRQLSPDDLNGLAASIFRLSKDKPAAIVTLEQVQLLLYARFEQPAPGMPIQMIVAGAETTPLSLVRSELPGVFLMVAPIIILLSTGVAYYITGRAMRPVDRIIREVSAITDGRSLHRRLPLSENDDELTRLAETLNAMIGRLEQSFGGLRRFTADASHELKTPLTVLRADIERAMASGPRSTEGLVALEEALQETARMASLVESLLTLARADEGRFDLHREPVLLEPLVRDVGETAQILGEAGGIKVTLGPLESVTVLGDPLRLRQLFLNLVTNAVKYTGKGGKIELSLLRRGDAVEFSVTDTGMGIAGADLPYVFDRFWRADRARSRGSERGGVGLGLSISQWIAHAHGGSITVASRLGRGSTFTVSLPAAGAALPGAPVSALPLAHTAGAGLASPGEIPQGADSKVGET